MTKEEFMSISTYEEFNERRNEFKGMKLDKEMREHAAKLFPKASATTEELFKTPPSKGGTIGR